MYTQNTFNKCSNRLISKLSKVFSVEERSASFPRKECQSSIFLAHLSFRKESDQLHYRSWSPFLPRLRHKSSAHQVTGDGVSNDHTASSPRPLSFSRRYLYCTDFPNRANCPERGCRPSPRRQRRIASSVLQLQSGLRSVACGSTLRTTPAPCTASIANPTQLSNPPFASSYYYRTY